MALTYFPPEEDATAATAENWNSDSAVCWLHLKDFLLLLLLQLLLFLPSSNFLLCSTAVYQLLCPSLWTSFVRSREG